MRLSGTMIEKREEDNMKCPNCGTETNDMEKVCSVCSTPLEGDTSAGGEEKNQVPADTPAAPGAEAAETAPAAPGTEVAETVPAAPGTEVAEASPEALTPEAAETSSEAPALEAAEISPEVTDESPAASAPDTRAYIPADPPAGGKKNGGKIAMAAAGIAAVAVIGGGVFCITRMLNAKDPKEVVIDAFKTVYSEEQTYPMKEIFGFEELAESSLTGDVEAGLSLALDSCSEAQVDAYKGLGMELDEKLDRTNSQFSMDLAAIYNSMDLLTLNMYYGNDTLMVAMPELVDQVFVADLGEGLAERVENSPTLGPLMETEEVDVEGLMDYIRELMEKAQSEQTTDPYGIQGAWTRYQEGCKAQEKFKAALTVEKSDKGRYLLDGQEVQCQGYRVHISKDSMIEFLRESSDFFLQDEELKETYLENLRTGTKLLELTGSSTSSAEELQKEVYDTLSEQAEMLIDRLDQGMQDVDMQVFVDKKGRLAALEGTTNLVQVDETTVPVTFAVNLKGGTYLTQNAWAQVTMDRPLEPVALELEKTGAYDGSQLDSSYRIVCNDVEIHLEGNYTVEGGDYSLSGNVVYEGRDQGSLEIAGVVDQLEKGKSIHLDMDQIRLEITEVPFELTMSGDYYIGPMTGSVSELQGETMDVFAATEDQWQEVFMRAFFSLMGIMGQLGL